MLLQAEKLSKPEIACRLKISLPTVAQSIKELSEMGLVAEAGELRSTGGRKAVAVAALPCAKIALGLDITRNHVGLVALNLKGEILKHERVSRCFADEPGYYQELGRMTARFVDECRLPVQDILGIGISVPGIVSPDGRFLLDSHVLGLSDCMNDAFCRALPYPSILCNDANAAGFAETCQQNNTGDLVFLSLSNSVGGAILINGNLYEGLNQRGGEFGHMRVVAGGRRCYCGQLGCLDAYCSADVLARPAGGRLEQFFALLEQGDQPVRDIWDSYAEHLIFAVNNLRMIFDCDVVLGGYVGSFLEPYLPSLRRMAAACDTFETDCAYLRVCTLKTEASAVGAARYPIQTFLSNL